MLFKARIALSQMMEIAFDEVYGGGYEGKRWRFVDGIIPRQEMVPILKVDGWGSVGTLRSEGSWMIYGRECTETRDGITCSQKFGNSTKGTPSMKMAQKGVMVATQLMTG